MVPTAHFKLVDGWTWFSSEELLESVNALLSNWQRQVVIGLVVTHYSQYLNLEQSWALVVAGGSYGFDIFVTDWPRQHQLSTKGRLLAPPNGPGFWLRQLLKSSTKSFKDDDTSSIKSWLERHFIALKSTWSICKVNYKAVHVLSLLQLSAWALHATTWRLTVTPTRRSVTMTTRQRSRLTTSSSGRTGPTSTTPGSLRKASAANR